MTDYECSSEVYYSYPFLTRQFKFHPLRTILCGFLLLMGLQQAWLFMKQDVIEPAKAWQNTDKVADEAFHARYGAGVMLADGTKVKALEQYHLPALVGVTQWDVYNGIDLMAMATPANRVEHCNDSPLFVGQEIALPTENPNHYKAMNEIHRAYFVKSVTGKVDNWATLYQYDDRSACLTKLTIDKNGAGYATWPRDMSNASFSDIKYSLSHGTKTTQSSYKHGRWDGFNLNALAPVVYAKDVTP